jgi:hypothetical protein
MKVKDWNIFCSTIGKQTNFTLLLAILAAIDFILLQHLKGLGLSNLILSILEGICIILGIYYLGYTLILTKRLVEKEYK